MTTSLETLEQRIRAAELAAHRPAGCVQLLAVSKAQSAEQIKTLAELGVRNFGENYLQEALPKINSLSDFHLNWHFIGHIQRKKAKLIAQHFDWVHSVDRLDVAVSLSKARADHDRPLNICVQVNVSREPQKSGILPEDLSDLIYNISLLPHLTLRGLMTIPMKNDDHAYHELHRLYGALQEQGYELDTLSMGMSDDFESAIAQGATLIRIGTALFGSRNIR